MAPAYFIQKQNLRIFQEGTGNSNTLFLSTTQQYSAFANKGIVLERKGEDKVMTVGHFAHLFNVRHGCQRRICGAKKNVFLDRQVEQYRLLRYHSNGLPETSEIQRVQWMPAECDMSLIRIIESLQ